ncbi:MAG: twin-arginine translocase TatA/TatE family subunit [Acidimicrobiales bacterium]
MGSIGPAEILVVLVIALVVLGPTRLPDAARSLGSALREFKRMSSGLQSEVRDAFTDKPTYPTPPSGTTSPSGQGSHDQRPPAGLPASSEQAEGTVVREPERPRSD